MEPYDKSVVTKSWVKRVANTREGDLRAHQIAYTYHHFARALDFYVFDDESVWNRFDSRQTVRRSDANWFAFATWATVSINRDIRNQRAPLRSERVLPVSVRPWLSPTIMNIKAADGQRVSRALSWGQRLVFLSTTFALLELLGRSKSKQGKPFILRDVPAQPGQKLMMGATWADAVMASATWDGNSTELQRDRHLQAVARGFDSFRQARLVSRELKSHMSDVDRERLETIRARNILMGNVLITAVEQDVVQRAVTTVIQHVPSWAVNSASAHLARWSERFIGVPRQLAALDIPIRLLPARAVVTALWARVMTDQILVMMLPTETLRLGRDIPALRASQPYFPRQLQDLAKLPGPDAVTPHPKDPDTAKFEARRSSQDARNQDLFRLVSSFDRSRGDGAGTGASDWRRYDERMNWAVNLLRSRQQDPTLFWSPYSTEDGERIKHYALPQRVGDPSDFEVIAPLEGLPVITE